MSAPAWQFAMCRVCGVESKTELCADCYEKKETDKKTMAQLRREFVLESNQFYSGPRNV